MTVHCPHCSTGYLLPDHLLGPRGARVRCPQCDRVFFVVIAAGEPALGLPASDVGSSEAATPDALGVEPSGHPLGSQPAEPLPKPTVAHFPAVAQEWASAREVAGLVLDDLLGRLGPSLDDARARGRVLSEFGPVLMQAYDEYRRRAGEGAPVSVFRAVLRERLAVDLRPGEER